MFLLAANHQDQVQPPALLLWCLSPLECSDVLMDHLQLSGWMRPWDMGRLCSTGCSTPGPEHTCPSDTPGCGCLHQNEVKPPVESEVQTALVQGFRNIIGSSQIQPVFLTHLLSPPGLPVDSCSRLYLSLQCRLIKGAFSRAQLGWRTKGCREQGETLGTCDWPLEFSNVLILSSLILSVSATT